MRRTGILIWLLAMGCVEPVPDMVFEAGLTPSPWSDAHTSPPRGTDGGADTDGGPDTDASMGPRSALAINEIQCRGDEWVELIWVDGTAPVDLTGWWVSDSEDPQRRIALEADAPLGANTYHVVEIEDDAPFNLSCETGGLLLGVDGHIVSAVSWTELPESGTWGRLPNRTGPFTQNRATPGLANMPPSTGRVRLNEVQCRSEEWIELYVPDNEPVDLTGWRLTDDAEGDGGHALRAEVEPGGYHVISGAELGFGIGCGEDELLLVNAAGHVADSVRLGPTPPAYTYGRLPNGTGPWAPTAPTQGAENQAPSEEHPVFDPERVQRIHIELTPAARTRLAQNPRTYVDAVFTMEGQPERTVGVRLKGRHGSFRPLDDKPALKVKFTHEDGDPFIGLDKIAMNNFVQDPSVVAEWTAYTLFRAMGVPAPRIGYAVVTINDEPKGLYGLVESMDDVALDRWFESTKHLYEGAYGQDLFLHRADEFEIDEGDDDRSDLMAVINAFDSMPPAAVYGASAALVNWPEVVTAMATEVFIGHWDGYAWSRNNYFLHLDDDGRLSLLPWGTDQTFRDFLDFDRGQGRLFELCFADLMCRAEFDANLVIVAETVDRLGLANEIDRKAEWLSPFLLADPFGVGEAHAFADQIAETKRYLSARQAEIREDLQCLSGANRDVDDDGFDCAVDCDDDDPNTHPGAREICGDEIDQNCSGWLDDGPDCPDCVPVDRGDHRYLVCTTPRTFDDARAHCRAQGGEMVVFEHPAEATSIARAAMETRWQRYWIGLTDRAEEGVYVWVDGQPLAREFWAEGAPNGGDEGDCVHAEADTVGRWEESACDERHAVICEMPCEAVDVDGDGFTECTGDCREGDRTIGPQRDELCGNEDDENCNGEIDDNEVCPRCTRVNRGLHAYAICRSERRWSDAREECWRMGYDLAVLENEAEYAWLARNAALLDVWSLWIGLTDIAREGRFEWVNNRPVEYAPWALGEPNDGGEGEDCAQIFPGGWNDLPCQMSIPFVCEAPCDGRDADGDGLDDCGADCDDTDREIGLECPE